MVLLWVLKPLIARAPSADHDRGVVSEDIFRNFQIGRRRTTADTTRGVIVRPMTGAEPAAVVTLRIAGTLPERHAAEIGANSDYHQVLGIRSEERRVGN